MGLEDRDWYRESFREKEETYGGDFSLHSKPKKKKAKSKKYSETTYRQERKRSTFNRAPLDDEKDMTKETILIPTECKRCKTRFNVRVRIKSNSFFTYTCPKCGCKMTSSSLMELNSYTQKDKDRDLLLILLGFIGSWGTMWLLSKTSIALMLVIAFSIYNFWLLFRIQRRPKVGAMVHVAEVFFFIISQAPLGIILYCLFHQ